MLEYWNFLWSWRLTYIVAIIGFLISISKIEKAAQKLYTPRSVRIIRIWAILMDLFFIIAILNALYKICTGVSNFKWILLFDICLLIGLVSEIAHLLKINRILFKPTNQVLANSYAVISSQQIEKDLLTEAKMSIQRACELAPEEPRHWLQLSGQEEDIPKAREYMRIAENLIKEKGLKSNKLLSWMEFNRGNLILGQNEDWDLALEHYNNSLELNYDKDRAAFIQKVKNAKELNRVTGKTHK